MIEPIQANRIKNMTLVRMESGEMNKPDELVSFSSLVLEGLFQGGFRAVSGIF